MDEGGHDGRPGAPMRLVAIDDRPVFVKGLRLTIAEAGNDFDLVEVVDTVQALNGHVADIALLELGLTDGSRPRDNVQALRAWGMAVVVCTGVYAVGPLAEALDAGASAIVLKHQSETDLLEAIRLAHRGETYLPDEVARRIANGEAARPRLSAREVEVLNLLYQGLITKQAARRLQVSESTVKEHLKRIRQKYTALGRPVSTRVQLLQIAHSDGFIVTDDHVPEEEE